MYHDWNWEETHDLNFYTLSRYHHSKNSNSTCQLVGRSLDMMDGQSEMLNNNQLKSKEDLASQPVQHHRKLHGPVGIVVALIVF